MVLVLELHQFYHARMDRCCTTVGVFSTRGGSWDPVVVRAVDGEGPLICMHVAVAEEVGGIPPSGRSTDHSYQY